MLRSPQECQEPEVTEMKVPRRGLDCSQVLSPQQLIAPLVRSPHECPAPTLTAL